VDSQYRDPQNHDARLTPFGEQQCADFALRQVPPGPAKVPNSSPKVKLRETPCLLYRQPGLTLVHVKAQPEQLQDTCLS
jgi:hypothetical protein